MAIPEALDEEILRRAVEGQTTRQIAEWCTSEGHRATHGAIANRLKKLRARRAEISKAVVREQLSKTLTSDIRRLERFAVKAVRLARKHESDPRVWCLLAAEVRKFTEAKLKAAGVDQPDAPKFDATPAAARRIMAEVMGGVTPQEPTEEPDGARK